MVLVVLTRPDERKPASPLHESMNGLVASLLFRSLSLLRRLYSYEIGILLRDWYCGRGAGRPVWSSGRDRSAEARRLQGCPSHSHASKP